MWLLFIAGFGFVVPNGLFVYWLFQDFSTVQAVLQDRLAVAFMIDVFVATGVLAVYFAKYPPGRYRWPWFVGFSLLGTLCAGLAFYWWLNKRPGRDATAG